MSFLAAASSPPTRWHPSQSLPDWRWKPSPQVHGVQELSPRRFQDTPGGRRKMGKGKEILTKFKTVKASLLATATLHRLLSVCASCQAQRWLRVYWNLQQVPGKPRGTTHLSWSNCSSAAQRSGREEGARWWRRAWIGRREKLGGHRLALVNREVNTWSTCRIHLRGRTKRKEAHCL